MIENLNHKGNSLALLPLLVFILTFLGVGYFMNDFYALPAPVAVLVGIFVAFILFKGTTQGKIDTLIKGCGDHKILTMCLIYLFAGAFATVSKAMGGVDSVVNIGIHLINVEYFPLGVFLIASFLSLATGTSVGAIVALGPIVVSLADKSGASLALMSASLLCGAMFGDNLSIISDTTIAATQSLGCKMKDKFKVNFFIALPAALLTIIILYYQGIGQETIAVLIEDSNYSVIAIVPYIVVIVLAMAGMNVFSVLFIGIILSGIIGIVSRDFTVIEFTKNIYAGFTSMTEIFLLSMLTGGLAALVEKAGGIRYVLYKINTKIKSKKSAQLGIASLVSITNMAIANNTVSIIITGKIAKEISEKYNIDSKKAASILDIFSCIIQGILPYGAQVLLILSFAGGRLNYFDLISNVWYLALLFIFTILSIYSSLWERRLLK
ncbi:Na+/H+ antiporter NhaC family protein [Flavobacterium sp. '19STA2R22 D10 B1']|uniref:Na+/H+ antiporter NhaC family protein n=1 Tax=Flavobacterium aerium TaxID=3037261 RepID=UPI00278C8CB9|nr:Na+/H+ antiporter NhaC family protein [Flavobacterium sp. '19STA2R22 D10 B1']